jgi:hypothetical protein
LKESSSVARLAGGGAVVVWTSGNSLMVQQLDQSGSAIGSPQIVGTVEAADAGVHSTFSVAGTAEGGWVVAWASSDNTMEFRKYDSSGRPTSGETSPYAGAFGQILSVDVQAFADTGIAIAWSARPVSASDTPRAYVQKFTGLANFTNLPGAQTDVHIVPLPNNEMLAAWIQASPDNTTFSIAIQRFDVMLKAIGTPEQLLQTQPLTGSGPADLAITSRADGTTLIAWAMGSTVSWQIVGADGAPGAGGNTSVDASMVVETIKAVPSASGFTLIAESTSASNRGTTGTINVFAIEAAGNLLSSSSLGQRTLWTVSPTTGDSCGPSPSGVAAGGGMDGRYVLAYESCTGQQSSQLQVLAP